MDSHTLSPLSFGSDFKAYILEATRTWQVQHEFSDCRCDTVCIWYNDNFLTRGAEQKSNPSSSQSLAVGLNGFTILLLNLQGTYFSKLKSLQSFIVAEGRYGSLK